MVLLHLIQLMIYSFIISYNKIKESAYETIQSHFARSSSEKPNFLLPPTYFKLGQLHEINEDKQEIGITFGNSMPVANTGGSIAVNKKAARILLDLYQKSRFLLLSAWQHPKQ